MKYEKMGNAVVFGELKWDTEFFGVNCARAILSKPVTISEWENLLGKFKNYQFISIQNNNSEPRNALFIGKETTSFLADVNIQFVKRISIPDVMPGNVKIFQAMDRDERILTMAEYPYSKFVEDPELAKRGGAEVYRQWLINSFGKQDKFYAISEGVDGEIEGYVLHSYSNKICTIELIAVLNNRLKSGIGARLLRAVECTAYMYGCNTIKVGTQARNTGAVNFYHKVGYEQLGCHQVYHLWNKFD